MTNAAHDPLLSCVRGHCRFNQKNLPTLVGIAFYVFRDNEQGFSDMFQL